MKKEFPALSAGSKNLKSLFEPQSIAVIGASRRPEAVGYAVLHNLVAGGYTGKIYPVNPKADRILDLTCYSSLQDIPGVVDLAVLIVPNTAVCAVLQECGQKGVKAAIIISAGFKEVGGEGVALEKEAVRIAREFQMPVLGPNCLGLTNTDPKFSFNASFSRALPRAGNIAFLSQSGALCAAILDYARGRNLGFSKFISLGNKADITELDILRYLREDSETDVILMYLEDLADGRAFINITREISGEIEHRKPILAIKAGRTPQGAKAASSHTGSLMGSDEVYDAIFAQGGVLRVDSVEEMFNFATGFANQPLPKGNRVAIITNAGGPGIMATDASIRYGLEMASLQSSTVEALKKSLPPTANISNPIDVIGDAQHERYEAALKLAAADPNVDALIVILTPQAMTDIEEIAKVVVDIDRKTDKPIMACFMGIVDVSAGVHILEQAYVPHYIFPEDAARTLGAMVRYQNWTCRPRTVVRQFEVERDAAAKIIQQELSGGASFLPIEQSMKILKAYHFPILPFAFAGSSKEAASVSRQTGFPAVMKIISRDIIHKMDVGGVKLHLQNEKEAESAYEEMMRSVQSKMPKAKVEGVFIQAMAKPGREVILGMKRDPKFGPILMFGLGGIYVEALKDVTFRLAPIREFGAQRMIESIRAYKLLSGIRGEKPSDVDAIMESLERLSQLVCDHPEIDEIDINPLMAYPQGEGAAVVDARIVLHQKENGASSMAHG